MRFRIALIALALAGCHHTEKGVEVRLVPTPVPQPCLPLDQMPPEPVKVAKDLTGNAAHDLAIVAASALDLRAWGQQMAAALKACAG